MEARSAVLDRAVKILEESTAHLGTVLSVEPLDRDHIVLFTIYGPMTYLVGPTSDGRIRLTEMTGTGQVH